MQSNVALSRLSLGGKLFLVEETNQMLRSNHYRIGRWQKWVLRGRTVWMLITALILSPATVNGQQESKLEFFESRIRPVLVEQCYECHNSAGTAEGAFALDYREPMIAGGAGGPVLQLDDAGKSRLMKILRHEIAGLEMPEGGEQLSPAVLDDFEKWISDGAFDPRDQRPSNEELMQATSWDAIREKRQKWWSFRPIVDYEIPAVTDDNTSQNPIDCFVHAKLSEVNLTPAPTASNETLVRRLYYTLVGLPPTFDELRSATESLANTAGSDRDLVLGELVDRLLASPRFGERWARHWMDWIRYAESHGSEGDPTIEQAWQYRDYLIRALNNDVPLDQLILEHIAGDLLESPRIDPETGVRESWIGPAHFRMVFHGFAPTDALDERVRFTDDQISSLSKAFLGLTISCARCHDHKFDPISQADYYAIYGILNTCRPGRTAIDGADAWSLQLKEMTEIQAQLPDALAEYWTRNIADETSSVLIEAFDKGFDQISWPTLSPEQFQHFWDLSAPSDYAKWHSIGDGLPKTPAAVGAIRMADSGEGIIESILPGGISANLLSTKLPARLSSPDIQLGPNEQCELWVFARGGGGATVRYVVHDYPRNGTVYPVRDLTDDWTWHKFDLSYWAGDLVHVELTTARDAPLLVRSNDRSWFDVRYCVIAEKGKFNPTEMSNLPQSAVVADKQLLTEQKNSKANYPVQHLISLWTQHALNDQQSLLLNQLIKSGQLPNRWSDDGRLSELVQRYRKLEQSIPVPTRVPALEETVGEDHPLFIRGDHKQPGAVVTRRFLEAIDPRPYGTSQSGRLQLAYDLLRDDNPLTRRVMVNRIWLHLFGQGIVTTPDNFGRMGDQPSHPELLDWLAVRLQSDGWSMKSLIRLIVMSETWQRDSVGDANAIAIDPENRFLSHQNINRLNAEAIRDTLLYLSGRLQQVEGGPPVSASQPRRSIYVNVIRNNLDPFLRVFDFPEPFSTVGRRDATNVPAQSLTLMNDPMVKRVAADLAKRTLQQPDLSSDAARAEWMMRETMQRTIDGDEVQMAVDYLRQIDEQLRSASEENQRLQTRLKRSENQLNELRQGVLSRLRDRNGENESSDRGVVLPPLHLWDFESEEGIELHGGAKIVDGDLNVNGGYALSDPIQHELTTKTIEVVVQLNSLDQRGGGAVTVQSRDGSMFDAIVFGERDARQWLAGSNNFARTQSFSGPLERDASESPIHFAIVYHDDGRIVGYRNGEVYGKPFTSNGPHRFTANETVVGFGIRHLPAIGNHLLSGTILKAGVYDVALNDDEVLALANSRGPYISPKQIEAAMSDEENELRRQLVSEIQSVQLELSQLGPSARTYGQADSWAELAHALFTLKEFIYVR